MKVRNLPLVEKLELYNKALQLRKRKKWGKRRIARKLGVPQGTVDHWLYHKNKPDTIYNHPDLSPSPELSYVIGVAYGDAYLYYCGKQKGVRLEVTDRDFMEEFNRCVSKVLGKKHRYPVYTKRQFGRKLAYGINSRSQLLYDFLKSSLNEHKMVVDSYPAEFIRGFFDSEGTVRKEGMRALVNAVNTNKEILILIQELLLRKFKIHSTFGITYRAKQGDPRKTVYYVGVNSKADVGKFRDLIGFSIARKDSRLRGTSMCTKLG